MHDIGWLLKLGGLGVIGIEIMLIAIPTSLFKKKKTFPCFLTLTSNGHPYIFFPLLVPGRFFSLFMVLCILINARVQSSMCMQRQKFLEMCNDPTS